MLAIDKWYATMKVVLSGYFYSLWWYRAGYIQDIGCLDGEFLLQLCAFYVW